MCTGGMFRTMLKVTFLKVCVLTGTYHLTIVQAAAPYLYKETSTRHCPLNDFVSVYENGTKRCTRCKKCPKGFEVKTPCSEFTDTTCEPCPSGWYNDVSGRKCEPCSGCDIGNYIRRSCEKTRNTKCRKCPRNMFSAHANMTTCLPCRKCKQKEKVVSKCSRSRDTVCGECFHDHFRISSTGSCLPCSPCPSQLRNKVVPECRRKLGVSNANICWPSIERSFRLLNLEDRDIEIEVFTENTLLADFEEQQNIKMKVIFSTALLGSFLGCILIIVVAFLCYRSRTLDKCKQCLYFDVIGGINDRIIPRAEQETNDARRDYDQQSRGKERNSFCSRGSYSDCTSLLSTDSHTLNVHDTGKLYDTCCPSQQPSWTSDCPRAIN